MAFQKNQTAIGNSACKKKHHLGPGHLQLFKIYPSVWGSFYIASYLKGKIKKKHTHTFYQYQFISLELVTQSPRHSNLQRRCSTVGCLPPTSCVLCPNQPPTYHLDKMGRIYGKCTKDSLPSFKRGLGIRWICQESTVFQVNDFEINWAMNSIESSKNCVTVKQDL